MAMVFRPRVRHHRNGCSGEGFFVVEFDDHRQHKKAHRLIASVFDGAGQVAVICPDQPLLRWRGDNFEPELRAIIDAAPDSETFNYRDVD